MTNRLLVLFSLAAAVFLRLFLLSQVPPSLSHDEVAIGYNAYSILRTGKDEYGTPFPLLFRSFDDYKLPGMVYATVPSIALFGLTEWGVRLPSAVFGIGAIFIFFFFVRELLQKNNKSPQLYFGDGAAGIVSLFFAFSIWHINFSRQSFESNGALFFLLLGSTFLLRATRSPQLVIPALISITTSLYFYYSVRVIIPFILLAYVWNFHKQLFHHKKSLLAGAVLAVVLLVPLVPAVFSREGLARIRTVSVFNDPNYMRRLELFTNQRIQLGNPLIAKIRYNWRTALLLSVAENYTKNVSPSHLFVKGSGPLGLQYGFEAPLILIGLVVLFHLPTKKKWLVAAWLLSAPLAGAFSVDQPNALRTLPLAPMLSLLAGLGFVSVLVALQSRLFKTVFTGIVVIVFLSAFTNFFYKYYYQYPRTNSRSFGDGYKQMVLALKGYEKTYDLIFVSGAYWRPYIFTLFWSGYEPSLYQREGTIDRFGPFVFGKARWDTGGITFEEFLQKDPLGAQSALFILSEDEFNEKRDRLTEIESIDGVFARRVFVAAHLAKH